MYERDEQQVQRTYAQMRALKIVVVIVVFTILIALCATGFGEAAMCLAGLIAVVMFLTPQSGSRGW